MKDKTKRGPGGPRPGSGRKPFPEDMKRSRRIMVSVTQQEYRALERAAGTEAVSSFVYGLICRSLSRRRK